MTGISAVPSAVRSAVPSAVPSAFWRYAPCIVSVVTDAVPSALSSVFCLLSCAHMSTYVVCLVSVVLDNKPPARGVTLGRHGWPELGIGFGLVPVRVFMFFRGGYNEHSGNTQTHDI